MQRVHWRRTCISLSRASRLAVRGMMQAAGVRGHVGGPVEGIVATATLLAWALKRSTGLTP